MEATPYSKEKPMTKTERRVLEAMRWETERVVEEAQADRKRFGWDEPIAGALLGFNSIIRAARILAMARKPSELQVYDALQKLVARGLVEKNSIEGMGRRMDGLQAHREEGKVMKDDRRYMSYETRAIDDARYRGKVERGARAVETCFCGKTVVATHGRATGATCPRDCGKAGRRA